MEQLNERVSIESDELIKVDFESIEKEHIPFLLIYEASKKLHKAKIKEKIIEYLHNEMEAFDIEAFSNSSIYFKLQGPISKTQMSTHNIGFNLHIVELELKFKGRIFWIFNRVLRYGYPSNPRIARAGRGNQSFYKDFEQEVSDILNSD